jgi:putative RNA 2'-phosphotransferase
MEDAQFVRISKFLSLHLRHQPERLGLTLGPGGWVDVRMLLAACAQHGMPLTRAELDEIVARNNKQRFSFDESGERIRANQGHSVEVDLQLTPVAPPDVLYHGTGEHAVPAILRQGLLKMARQHVHLSADVSTAHMVGKRHGRPVIFQVDAAAMADAGMLFYCSANGVWLTDHVPPQYLTIIEKPNGA